MYRFAGGSGALSAIINPRCGAATLYSASPNVHPGLWSNLRMLLAVCAFAHPFHVPHPCVEEPGHRVERWCNAVGMPAVAACRAGTARMRPHTFFIAPAVCRGAWPPRCSRAPGRLSRSAVGCACCGCEQCKGRHGRGAPGLSAPTPRCCAGATRGGNGNGHCTASLAASTSCSAADLRVCRTGESSVAPMMSCRVRPPWLQAVPGRGPGIGFQLAVLDVTALR